MFVLLLSFISCAPIDICTGTPPSGATSLIFEMVVWQDGPYYESEGAWDGVIYRTQEEWEAYLGTAEVENPVPDVDFSSRDVLLYERVYNGCDYEVMFDGAYLLDNTRYIRSQRADLDQFCDAYFPEHSVLVVEKVEGSNLEMCALE